MPALIKPMPAIAHPLMDGEHAQLLTWADEAIRRIAADAQPDEVLYALDTLAHLTRSHFAHEQQEMRAAAYPKTIDHSLEHGALLRQLAQLRAQAKEGRLPAAAAQRALRKWLKPHIAGHDSRYADWLRTPH